MRKLAIVGMASLLVGAFALEALAEKIPNDNPFPPDNPGQCNTQTYKSRRSAQLNLNIPDADPAGVTTPPIQFVADGTTIADVVISLEISHTWVGDLNVSVSYDHDCQPATPAFGPVALLCRQQLAGCPVDGCCGCSGDLLQGGRYDFGTVGSTKELAAAGQCPLAIPFGCYRPALESQFQLDVFASLRKDGCWILSLQDGAGADLGVLYNWEVRILNQVSTAVENATWGAIKAGYND